MTRMQNEEGRRKSVTRLFLCVRTLFLLSPVFFLMSFLLSASVFAANPRGEALIDAARNGDVVALRALLQQHVDVNATTADGATPLHWAAHRGDLAAVDLLLKAGARGTAANAFGVTPRSLGVEGGNKAVVERLLKSGADANTRLKGGETVLMSAARMGQTESVRALVEAGADVNAKESTRG